MKENKKSIYTSLSSKSALISCAILLATNLSGCGIVGGGGGSGASDSKGTSSETTYDCEYTSSSSQESYSAQTVAIIAPTQSFVSPETISDRFKSSATGAVAKRNSRFDVIIADGAPRVVAQRGLKNDYMTSQDFDKAAKSVIGMVQKVGRCATGRFWTKSDNIAVTPQSDLLASLAIGANGMMAKTKDRRIYVVSNGLQTAGAIRMQDSGKLPSSTQMADLLSRGLKNLGQLPNLKGVKIYWYGIGQTQGTKQKPLSTKTKAALAVFWTKVIKLSGGELIELQLEGLQSSPAGDHAIKVDEIKDVVCPLLTIDTLEYKPDTAEYLNLSAAKRAAKMVVSEFKNAPGCQTLTVTGYAASGRSKQDYLKNKASIDRKNLTLTLKRAKAFEALLKQAGFTGMITAVGKGTGEPDWATNGKPDPTLQAANRRIEVTN
jgi:hypothetical protein